MVLVGPFAVFHVTLRFRVQQKRGAGVVAEAAQVIVRSRVRLAIAIANGPNIISQAIPVL